MIIRPLTETDVDKIVNIKTGDFSDGWNKEMLDSAFKTERLYAFGCFMGDNLVGYITFMTADDTADLETVVVLEGFRKKGIAYNLINKSIEKLKEINVKKFFLEVRKSNFSAINLYEKVGFTKISERKKYYPDGEDAVVMIKEF